MTARERIKEFLTGRKGYVSSAEIHNHLCSMGYQRSSSDGTLSKMVARGEVIRRGEHQKVECKLNRNYKPSAASLRQTANHKHLSIGLGLNTSRPIKRRLKLKACDNGIFDLCRENSRIYELIDRPIREVRP